MKNTNTKNSISLHSFVYLVIFILFFMVAGSNGQVSQQWASRYNGPGNNLDVAYSTAVDASGNVYVTGSSTGNGTNYDFATIKYNSAGVQQWVQRYNGSGNSEDVPYSIVVDGTGNVYVTGYSRSGAVYGTENYATIKYNSSGVQQWIQSYNGSGNNVDIAYSVAVDASGNVYVTGSSIGTGTDYDYATIKYNSSGILQWSSRYNGTGNSRDGAKMVKVDGAGNVYVTGCARTGSVSGTEDFMTIKYNSSGLLQWAKSYPGTGNGYDVANSLAVDGAGNVYAAGASIGTDSSYDYAVIKYNSSGSQQWVQRYNGPGTDWDEVTSIAVDIAGNVYVTGYSTGTGLNFDYATIKYNSSGVQQWLQRYNGPGNSIDQAISMAVDASGNVYTAGWSIGNGTGFDYAVIKYNSSGVQQWLQRYNGPANSSDVGACMVIDTYGNVYITGQSEGNGTSSDYATIKYSPTVGIEPLGSEVPDGFSLSQNYPNPFNPATHIKFQIAHSGSVSLKIYDTQGKEVAVLVNEELNPGTFEMEWDALNYTSGVYFYKLVSADFSETKKMLMVK